MMKPNKQRNLLALFVAGLLICAGCTTAAPTELPLSGTPVHAETDAPPTEDITPTLAEPSQTPAGAEGGQEGTAEEQLPAETPQEIVEDACLRCHSDRQMLIDTAFPEDILVSENEGEG
jgi:hypothetical protein